jgi:hypothetical protein
MSARDRQRRSRGRVPPWGRSRLFAGTQQRLQGRHEIPTAVIPARCNHVQRLTCTRHVARSRHPQQCAQIDEILRTPLVIQGEDFQGD